MPCLPVPICIRRRLPVENFPQHKSRGKSALLQERKQLTSEKKAYLSKDKPCILKKRLNGVFDQNAGLIIQRFPREGSSNGGDSGSGSTTEDVGCKGGTVLPHTVLLKRKPNIFKQ